MKPFYDVFISYGRADSKAFAIELNERLIKEGLNVWFDQKDIPPAVDFQTQINDGIEKAHNFIFIIAPHSVKSPYCLKEIELAVKYNKRIIPLLHVNCDRLLDSMHPTIRKLNWLFFEEEINNFEESFAGLINVIGQHSDYVEKHTGIFVKALKWLKNQKQTSYLLSNQERSEAQSWLKKNFPDQQPPCEPTDLHCEFICESIKNANNLMTEVFIAHAEKDEKFTEKIRKTLQRQGLTIWTYETDIKTGTQFLEEINKGIEQADNVIYLISAEALQSEYCQQEIKYAFALNKRIIPLLIENINIDKIQPQVRALQFIDFTQHQQPEEFSFSENKLLNILNADAHYHKQHKILLAKALKWQKQNRNPSLLLRGYNLEHYQTWLDIALSCKQYLPLPLQIEFIKESSNQPVESSLDVFVSYSRADSDFARKLNDSLQEIGKTTWFDQESIALGADFEQEIKTGIESCDNFLFVISPNSLESPYCGEEVEYAQKLNKRFVSILYKKVDPRKLHSALAKVQWIDFNRLDGDFGANFNELIRTIDTDREYLKNHTLWWQRAREWKKHNHSADLLLRGTEFANAQQWLNEALEKKLQPPPMSLCKEFIDSSEKAIAVAKQKEILRQKQLLSLQQERAQKAEELLLEKEKSAKKQKTFLRVTLAVAAVAIISSIWNYKQYRQATINELQEFFKSSPYLFVSNPNSEKLVEAIAKVQRWRKLVPNQQQIALNALLQVAYHVKGNNGESILSKKRLIGHDGEVRRITFSPDGEVIASASFDKTIKLWNSQSGALLQTLEGHEKGVFDIAFSPDGQKIVSASTDRTIKIWDRNGELLQTLEGHEGGIYDVAFSNDGQLIASASLDNTVKLWKLEEDSYSFFKTLEGHKKGVFGVAFSPDNETIASASWDKTVKIWHKNGQHLKTFSGHKDVVYDVSFSHDGETIISASADETVKHWNQDGILKKSFQMPNNFRVYQSVFNPQNRDIIAVASEDKTVKIWHRNGNLIATLFGHQNRVQGVAFSPDGKKIASASEDNHIIVWDLELDLDRLLELSCDWLDKYMEDNPNQNKSKKINRISASCRK